MLNYKKFISDKFNIVNKAGVTVPFEANRIQESFLSGRYYGREIILKSRQMGFSSWLTAMFTAEFILEKNVYTVIVADIEENAEYLLEKVKYFLDCWQGKSKIKLKLKYESKFELYNEFMNNKISIGTAKNTDFGRSRTITNLLLSECAFYPDIMRVLAGAGQAVPQNGKLYIETTANGFNEFKSFYDSSKRGETGYRTHFYKASDFYDKEFLLKKRNELGYLYPQEYPENDIEAFLVSGDCYFDTKSLSEQLNKVGISHNDYNIIANINGARVNTGAGQGEYSYV